MLGSMDNQSGSSLWCNAERKRITIFFLLGVLLLVSPTIGNILEENGKKSYPKGQVMDWARYYFLVTAGVTGITAFQEDVV